MTAPRSALVGVLALLDACDGSAAPPAVDAAVDATPDRVVTPDAATPDAATADCDPTGAAYTLTTEHLTVAGLDRTFTLAAPSGACGALSLVLVFHGDGGAAGRTQHFLHLEDATLGRAVVVYPDGLPLAGSPTGAATTWDVAAAPDGNRDVALFDALVAAMRARFAIDPRRVFATGLSRGAYFVNQLGCVRGDVLRAIAPNSGAGPFAIDGADAGTFAYESATLAACPTPAVSAMVIHGADDATVPPAAGARSRLHWEHFNGCSAERAPEAPAPCEASRACRDGQRVLWCLVPGLGHGYWAEYREAVWGFFGAMR